jgi:malate dehydrogenase (oxaloacetate-decarboxylating)
LALEEDVLNLHRILNGKIEIQNRIPIDKTSEEQKGKETLSLIYTPGVAFAAKKISNDINLAYNYTSKWNNVAIVCDGSRILGLGNIGPYGAIPVMEGKSVLFKALSGINAYPLCIDTKDKEEIIRFVKALHPSFGAVNIEDIESPKVLEIVEKLQKDLEIPVFHDDQHGTAVITLAALLNALKFLDKKIDKVKVVIAGAGSAGYGIFKILYNANFKNVIVTDSHGVLTKDRAEGMMNNNRYKQEIANKTNVKKVSGNFVDMLKESDVFIGVSGKAGLINEEMVKSMNKDSIIFALSNPDPEIVPADALKAGAKIVATGSSDYANQVNNALVFPYFLRGLLDARAKRINEDMLIAVANAIAALIPDNELKEDYIIPRVHDLRLISTITRAVKDTCRKDM